MNEKIYEDVRKKNKLAVITDKNGSIIWESAASPAAELYRAYFKGKFQGMGSLAIYSNQAGLAVAILAKMIQIEDCYAVRMSECGWKKFREDGIAVQYEEMIPLIKSSKDDSMVCPIELFLSEHKDSEKQWSFLKERFDSESDEHIPGSTAAYQK